METYKARGKVVAVGEVKTFASGFTKRDLVVDVSANPQFKSPVPFTLKKEKTALADAVSEGDEVAVDFTVDGRAWDSGSGVRYFVDITAWAVEVLSSATLEGAWTAFTRIHGDDRKAFAALLDATCPDVAARAKKDGVKFSAVADEEDWAKVVAAITGSKDETVASDPDVLPF